MNEPKYNSMAFTPEEVEKGMPQKLIQTLLDLNNLSEDHFNSMHITTDSYCTIVEWVWGPVDRSYGGHFEFVDENQYVETEREQEDE